MSSALFLDRDGVLNHRLPGAYVQEPEAFEWLPGSVAAIARVRPYFERIIVVTNQQGIGKGLMTEAQLALIHQKMIREVEAGGAYIDAIYFCPALIAARHPDRKPAPGMALRAKSDFPEIDFSQSIMVGDAVSDMLFGKRLGMKTVMVESNPAEVRKASLLFVDQRVKSLDEWSRAWLAKERRPEP